MSFLTSPMVAVMVLAVLALEAVVLLVLWKRSRMGLPPVQTLSFLGAGGGFGLALFSALGGMNSVWIAIGLTCAFFFHLMDLKNRWR